VVGGNGVAKKLGRADLRGADADVLQIVALQSGDPDRIRRVLDPANTVSPAILPLVISLLAVGPVAHHAMHALRRVADRYPGALVDALVDPRHPTAVRRRVARVLSAGRSQLVVDGLLITLDDEALDVRLQAARSLFRIRRESPDVVLDENRILDFVRLESERDPVDLAHLFTLLAFVLPVAPMRAAYRGLRGADPEARGTAIEYLNEVLPKEIRKAVLEKVTVSR
jgi:hypothetical protein